MAHPPPSSREAMPPLQFTQKGNVNIVPPMTKKKAPDDVKKAIGAAATPSAGKAVNGQKKKGLPPIPDDVRRLHGGQQRTGAEASPKPKAASEELPQTSEIPAPLNEIEATAESRETRKEVLNSELNDKLSKDDSQKVSEKQTGNPSSETIDKQPDGEPLETGAIPKTSKTEIKETTDENKPPSKKEDKADMKRKIPPSKPKKETKGKTKPVTSLKSKSLKDSSKPVKTKIKGDNSNGKVVHGLQSEETVIDIEGDKSENKQTSPLPFTAIPTIDVEQFTPRKESQKTVTDGKKTDAGKSSPVDEKTTGRKEAFVIKNETTNDQKDLDDFFDASETEEKVEKKTDHKLSNLNNDKLDLQSVSTSQSPQKDMHLLHPPVNNPHFGPTKNIANGHDDTARTLKATGLNGQQHLATVANISSNAEQIVPSVESIVPTDSSSAASEKALDSDTHTGNFHDTDSFTSNSEVDIPSPPPKQTKHFLFDPEPTSVFRNLTQRNGNTDSFFGIDPHEELPPSKPVTRHGRSTGAAKSAASSRLLKSSYGTKPPEALTVYNPAIAKKDKDPIIKDMEHNKKEREKREMERMRKIRMGAMSSAYGNVSPTKGLSKKK
jgi:hypothetical protein